MSLILKISPWNFGSTIPKVLLKLFNFLFLIKLFSGYIEHNLCRRAELKFHINPITVDIRLFSSIPPLPSSSLPPRFALNHMRKPWQVAPHLSWGMWAQLWMPHLTQKSGRRASAPPLSRGMWAASARSMEDSEWIDTRGDPRIGMPNRCITKMGLNICCGPFSPISPSSTKRT